MGPHSSAFRAPLLLPLCFADHDEANCSCCRPCGLCLCIRSGLFQVGRIFWWWSLVELKEQTKKEDSRVRGRRLRRLAVQFLRRVSWEGTAERGSSREGSTSLIFVSNVVTPLPLFSLSLAEHLVFELHRNCKQKRHGHHLREPSGPKRTLRPTSKSLRRKQKNVWTRRLQK